MGFLDWKQQFMVPGKAAPSTGDVQIIHNTEDGIDLARGITVPTDAATGYAPGCIFLHVDGTTGTTVYINEGTKASADFNALATAENLATIASSAQIANAVDGDELVARLDAETNSGTAGGTGPSPSIWDAAPVLSTILNPTDNFYFFDDFLGPIDVTTGDGWTITAVTTGGISVDATEEGGVLLVDSQGNASADDGVNAQLTNCLFKPAAGRTIYFEARVKVVDAGTDQYFIGLAGVDTTLIAAGVVDDVVDKCGFFRHAASTADKISAISSRTSSEEIDADVDDLVDDTYIKLGFVIDGLTSVTWYVNGVAVGTVTDANDIPNAVMCLSFVAQCEQVSADAELRVDWVRILQTGGRAS